MSGLYFSNTKAWEKKSFQNDLKVIFIETELDGQN